ncbi:MAG: UDP-N-acetylglucosamine 2-epimerase (non-hydrolyzing) [Elusimicrobiaceae bacterium]
MKIMTILGTRPEIIRLSLIIKKLDKTCSHILVHTGQNHHKKLNDIFFEDLQLRKPDYYLGAQANSFGEQLSIIIREIEKLLIKERPDRVLVLGDTNSGLTAVIAERMGIPVYHMEAGNRCFDLKVPEEKNRRVIDAISSYAMPYTPGSKENLQNDGIPARRIFVCGNPIYEVIEAYHDQIESSGVLEKLGLKAGGYFIVTAHRAENVDTKPRLAEIINGLESVAKKYKKPVICSIHPRTKAKLEKFKIKPKDKNIVFREPFGFFDFVKLEKNALCALTDSGTVQEECCIFNVPAVTMRDTTERPETVHCGSNMVSTVNGKRIAECAAVMLAAGTNWRYPQGYIEPDVSDRVVKFILGEN